MQNKDWKYNIFFTYGALICGVLVGSLILLLAVILGSTIILDMGLEDYKIGAVLNISTRQMMIYIIKKRIIQFIIFGMLLYLFPYGFSASLFCGSFGIYYGMVLTNLIIKYGISGLLYGVVCFCPHYLCYFWIIYLFGKWRINSLNLYYTNMNWIVAFGKIFVIILLILISLIWEICFQKIFLNYFFSISSVKILC